MKNKTLLILTPFLIFCIFILLSLKPNNKGNKNDKPNIIFISIDDLRPQLNCYRKTEIISPNIDSLASRSYLYENAVCNFPVLLAIILINLEIPSGPNLSIVPISPFFQKKKPIFFAGLTKITSYNSSMYHFFNKKLYKGKFVFLKLSKIFVL